LTTESDLIKVISTIMDEIDSEKSNYEYGYSWKQRILKDLDISTALKKKLGMWDSTD